MNTVKVNWTGLTGRIDRDIYVLEKKKNSDVPVIQSNIKQVFIYIVLLTKTSFV